MTHVSLFTGIGGKIAMIDTEYGSASKYADRFDTAPAPELGKRSSPMTFPGGTTGRGVVQRELMRNMRRNFLRKDGGMARHYQRQLIPAMHPSVKVTYDTGIVYQCSVSPQPQEFEMRTLTSRYGLPGAIGVAA